MHNNAERVRRKRRDSGWWMRKKENIQQNDLQMKKKTLAKESCQNQNKSQKGTRAS